MTQRFDGSIGTLATAFNTLLAQIQSEQARLEDLVAALDVRTATMQLVFDHVEQGILMVDPDGSLAVERSAALERWLGPIPASGKLTDYVRTFAPELADWFELQWDALRDGMLPIEICLAQLPSHFEVAGRHLEVAYKPLTDIAHRLRVLVVLSDVTDHVHRQRAERDEREMSSVVSRLLRGRTGFLAFHAEAAEHVVQIACAGSSSESVLHRRVHTLKGICSLEGIDSIAELCHSLETALAEADELAVASLRRAIAARWELVTSRIAPLLASEQDRVEVRSSDLARLDDALARGASAHELAGLVGGWRHERVASRLERFADDARVLAARLGKDPIDVEVDVDDDLRLPAARWAPFWSAFVHAVRNAIDHGIESAAEREAANKPPHARLALRARRRADLISIEIEDSGRGIDWARVAEVARRNGLSTAAPADLTAALFHDGLTTRDRVTETSGRGVGLAALRAACEATGGRITVSSQPGVGTTIAFLWPAATARPDVLQLAG